MGKVAGPDDGPSAVLIAAPTSSPDGGGPGGAAAAPTGAAAAPARPSRSHALSDLICLRHLDQRRCLAADAARQLRQGADIVIMTIPPPRSKARVPTPVAAAPAAPAAPIGPDVPSAPAGEDGTPGAAAAAAPAASPEGFDAAAPALEARLLAALRAAGISATADACRKGETPGSRFFAWEAAGAPLRAEIGAREAASGAATLAVHPALAAGGALAARLAARREAAALLLPGGGGGGGGGGPAQALRLAAVPVERAAEVCAAVLEEAAALAAAAAAAPAEGRPSMQEHPAAGGGAGGGPGRGALLPHGHCSKLHLWEGGGGGGGGGGPAGHDDGPAGCGDGGAPLPDPGVFDASRPCVVHVRHLLRLGPPCHCAGRRHVGMTELLAESEAALLRQRGLAVARWERAAPPPAPPASTLFVSGLPQETGAARLQQQLAAALQPYGLVKVQVAQGFRGRARGWARAVVDSAKASAAIADLDGRLALPGASAPARVSRAAGRADALFSGLPFAARAALRIDDVAAYSVMDDVSARAMAALAVTVTAAAAGAPPPPPGDGERTAAAVAGTAARGCARLSAADVTACCGGTALALAGAFESVTAVELEPERARDLQHNLRVAGLSVARLDVRALGAPGARGGGGGEAGPRGVRVVCGDAVALLEALGWHDCCVVDPPWGGPGYLQQQAGGQGGQGDGEGDGEGEGESGGKGEGDEERERERRARRRARRRGREDAQEGGGSGASTSDSDSDSGSGSGSEGSGGGVRRGAGDDARRRGPARAARAKPPVCCDMPLGGEPLSRLCARLAPLCRVALLRLPRRGFDACGFAAAVAAECLRAQQQEQQQQQQQEQQQQQQQQQQQEPPLVLVSELGRSQLLVVVYGGAIRAEEPPAAPSGRSRKRWQLYASTRARGGGGCGGGGGGDQEEGRAWRLPELCSVYVPSRGCFVRCERDVVARRA